MAAMRSRSRLERRTARGSARAERASWSSPRLVPGRPWPISAGSPRSVGGRSPGSLGAWPGSCTRPMRRPRSPRKGLRSSCSPRRLVRCTPGTRGRRPGSKLHRLCRRRISRSRGLQSVCRRSETGRLALSRIANRPRLPRRDARSVLQIADERRQLPVKPESFSPQSTQRTRKSLFQKASVFSVLSVVKLCYTPTLFKITIHSRSEAYASHHADRAFSRLRHPY